ncbi:hypothetical protein Mapa_009811 [Marchantia paleacea]|nr:hypothetical protein Mapa_009811 [Marchantia paleacea]
MLMLVSCKLCLQYVQSGASLTTVARPVLQLPKTPYPRKRPWPPSDPRFGPTSAHRVEYSRYLRQHWPSARQSEVHTWQERWELSQPPG